MCVIVDHTASQAKCFTQMQTSPKQLGPRIRTRKMSGFRPIQ